MNHLSKAGIFALLLTSSLTIMVGTVLAPSLSEISRQLGFENSPGWLITLPSLGVVLFAPVAGRLIDKKGPYVVMIGGLLPYAVIGVMGAVVHHPVVVVIDRVLLGFATAAVQASGTGLIAQLFTGEKRMQMVAWQGMAIELGGVVFLSVGGILGEWGWRYPFFIYLLGLVCAWMVVQYIPKGEPVEKEQGDGQLSDALVMTFVSAGFAMILFFVAFVGLPLYLPDVFHFSESQTGYFMAMISLIAVVAASQMPKVVRRMNEWNTVMTGFGCFMLGLGLFYIGGHVMMLFAGALSMGIGFGFTVPLLNHMTIEKSTPANRGRHLGYYSMGIFGGQFLSSVITEVGTDISITFLIGAVVAAVFLLFLQLKKVSPQPAEKG